MSSLEEENAKLRDEIEKLKANNEKLQDALDTLNEKYSRVKKTKDGMVNDYVRSKINSRAIILDTIRYNDKGGKPYMQINNFSIYFESAEDNTAQLAKLICQPKHLAKISKGFVTIEEIYNWHKYSEDWFDVGARGHEDFRKRTYQEFRRINDKVAPFLENKRLFEAYDGKYSFNKKLRLFLTMPNI